MRMLARRAGSGGAPSHRVPCRPASTASVAAAPAIRRGEQERGSALANRKLQPERDRQRQARRRVADVPRDRGEAATAREHVHRAKRRLASHLAAAHPEQPPELDARAQRRLDIERIGSIDQRGNAAGARHIRQTGQEHARSPRRAPTHNLGDLTLHHHSAD